VSFVLANSWRAPTGYFAGGTYLSSHLTPIVLDRGAPQDLSCTDFT
jgi:hypothetical protein